MSDQSQGNESTAKSYQLDDLISQEISSVHFTYYDFKLFVDEVYTKLLNNVDDTLINVVKNFNPHQTKSL